MPSSVRTKRSSRGVAPVSSRTAASIAAVSMSISSPAAVSGERLEVRLHAPDLRDVQRDRGLDLLGDVVRLVERKIARELEVERDLDPPVDVEHREVVDLAHVRDRQRGGEHSLAQRPVAAARLDVDDDVDPGERLEQRLSTRSAAACP